MEAGVGSLVAPAGQLAGALIRRVAGPAAVVGAIGTLVTGGDGDGGVRTVTRRQLILLQAKAFNPGATAKKIIRTARLIGIELAAQSFGISPLDLAFLIAQRPTRRARGISAADMRCVSRTARKFETLQHNLSHLCAPKRRYHRKK